MSDTHETAYLAGGCFWGMEELFRVQPGVVDTDVGYTGGENDHPTYRNHPGHAEALAVTYDPAVTSFRALLDFFFRVHNPTTLNQQGNDRGTSYRSTIFFRNEAEKSEAQAFIELVDASGKWGTQAVTTLEPFTAWWPAEPEHQDYLQRIPHGYTCHAIRHDSFLA